ncbi:MAG: hypothetical protein FWF51_12420 [Chitinivibrionia bacterium]|nr:hypothetical protein [Chitinivibrionia bacterium]
MLTRWEMFVRMEICRQKNVPITNYGVAILFLQDSEEKQKQRKNSLLLRSCWLA